MLDAWHAGMVARSSWNLTCCRPRPAPPVVRDLLRWNCDYLRGLRRDADAEAVARRLTTVDSHLPSCRNSSAGSWNASTGGSCSSWRSGFRPSLSFRRR